MKEEVKRENNTPKLVGKEPTIEELKVLCESKTSSCEYWMNECLKVQKQYENLRQMLKSLSEII